MGGDELPRGSLRFAAGHGGAFAMRRLAVYSRRPPSTAVPSAFTVRWTALALAKQMLSASHGTPWLSQETFS